MSFSFSVYSKLCFLQCLKLLVYFLLLEKDSFKATNRGCIDILYCECTEA